MTDTKHTVASIGERAEEFYAEARAFYAKAETRTDTALAWWQKSHWSALIGVGLFILAMIIGDILSISRLF